MIVWACGITVLFLKVLQASFEPMIASFEDVIQ